MRRIGKWISIAVLLVAAGLVIAWATSPDPRGNPASFEDAPVEPTIALLDEALTLAGYDAGGGSAATLLVTAFDGETITGVDLGAFGGGRTGDVLQDLASADRTALTAERLANLATVSVGIDQLLPAGSSGAWHIGTGTNFPEHAEESNSDSVFSFPKFGEATPARTQVRGDPAVLLDYEVELCMRFDRAVGSAEDFDAAVKGVFLCGDFTNRNALVEMADPDNLDSGYGFSDAKSGPGSYPSGPFVVVPNDWSSFVADLRMTTAVNGEPRQDARGGEMTLDFRELAIKSLADMSEARFFYDDGFTKLAPDGVISTEMTLMSGTSEGVIFTGPSRADYIEGVAAYFANGGPFSNVGLIDRAKQQFIANELASKHFLQPGDIVRHDSNVLGNIEVTVVQ